MAITFKVIKSSFDGISGGDSGMDIDEVCRNISYSKGWHSLEQLHASIRKWAAQAKPGTVYTTAASAIVATGCLDSSSPVEECHKCGSDEVEYGELDPVEDGNIEQHGWCNDCGEHWLDVFVFAERHELAKKKKK